MTAFFSGAIDAAGSFGGIYQSAVLAYGSDLIKDPPDPSRRFENTVLAAVVALCTNAVRSASASAVIGVTITALRARARRRREPCRRVTARDRS